jgi:hypothetical protein
MGVATGDEGAECAPLRDIGLTQMQKGADRTRPDRLPFGIPNILKLR